MFELPSLTVCAGIFGQTFEWHDAVVIGLLIVLEGVLSIDNALVLGLLAKRLPKHQQQRALTYGLVGAFVFRILAITTAAFLLEWPVVKLFGGGYLVYIAVKHLFFESKETIDETIEIDESGQPELREAVTGAPLTPEQEELEIEERVPLAAQATKGAAFWPTVAVIELTDVAFAVDSILAAVGVVGDKRDKLWVIISGGILGVILMRFAAVLFIKLLDRFPRFEMAAYLLVIVIGGKLLVDYLANNAFSDHNRHLVDFHNVRSTAFWVFWVLMIACFSLGFTRNRGPRRESDVSNSAS